MVDDEHLYGDFFGFEFEAELFLEGGEDGGEVGVGVAVGVVEFDVVVALDAGFVEDGAAYGADESSGEGVDLGVLEAELAGEDVSVGGSSFGDVELWSAFGDDEDVAGEIAGLAVRDEVEALLEELLEERLELFVGEVCSVGGFGVDVEELGVEPVGCAGELIAAVDAEGELNEVGEMRRWRR